MQDDPQDWVRPRRIFGRIAHYHGGTVRQLFIAAATFILIILPFYPALLPLTPAVSIVLVVLLALFAALTNPKQKWVTGADVAISAAGVLLFEYFAVVGYGGGGEPLIFLARQVLAVIFLFALYYSGRTFRAMVLEQVKQEGGER